jgi:hypothetical protein
MTGIILHLPIGLYFYEKFHPMNTTVECITDKQLLSYQEYKDLVLLCAAEKTTTGGLILPERVEATLLNAQRMKRIDKQFLVSPEVLMSLQQVHKNWIWLILVEAWCGDGAQNVPVLAGIESHSGYIQTYFLLRDEHPEIMETCLTNGSSAIPKLICIDAASGKELGTWGPRPKKIQEKVREYKTLNPNATHDEFVLELHGWYAQDKGNALQEEFSELIRTWAAQ